MKRLLKYALRALLAVALLAVAAAAYFQIKGVPSYPYSPTPEMAAFKAPTDSAHIERGAKIASLLCNECHRDQQTGNLTGRPMLDLPKEFGTVHSYNITQDPVKGIGAWTDGELLYFLRTGTRKDGSWAPPFMPKFPLMADDDLASVVAWLRSDRALLKPQPQEYPANEYNLLIKFLSNTAFSAPPLPAQKIAVPDTTDRLALGRYVANGLCACYQCHSADFKTMDILVPEKSAGFYGGGNPMLDFEGHTVPTANITMDNETGIGQWTRAEFRDAVKYNKSRDGKALHYPMFPHASLTDGEVDAVHEYLKTVPAIKNRVERASF